MYEYVENMIKIDSLQWSHLKSNPESEGQKEQPLQLNPPRKDIWMVHVPTFSIENQPNVGKHQYTTYITYSRIHCMITCLADSTYIYLWEYVGLCHYAMFMFLLVRVQGMPRCPAPDQGSHRAVTCYLHGAPIRHFRSTASSIWIKTWDVARI